MPNLSTDPDNIRLNERQERLQFIGKTPFPWALILTF